MTAPKTEYTAIECIKFLKKEIHFIRKELAESVNSGKIDKNDARQRYDYYLNIYILVEICAKMEESESYLKDRTFSLKELYKPDITSADMLLKIMKKL